MKEQFIFCSIFVISAVLYSAEAIREGNKWSRHRKSANERWTRSDLASKTKDKRIKLNTSHGKKDSLQKKRQFVPEMPFFNFPRPHIHRIIVHHHPGA